MQISRKSSQAGFTILELMIATTILSVVLLVVSAVFLSISTSYTKGVTGSRLQNSVRGAVQELTGLIEFSSDTIQPAVTNGPNGESAICIGNEEFTFIPNMIQGVDKIPAAVNPGQPIVQHVLWESPIQTGCVALDLTQPNPSTTAGLQTGSDLGITHEGLSQFTVNDSGGQLVNITINAFDAPGSDLLNPGETSCLGTAGDQFCFTVNLTTTVERRVQS